MGQRAREGCIRAWNGGLWISSLGGDWSGWYDVGRMRELLEKRVVEKGRIRGMAMVSATGRVNLLELAPWLPVGVKFSKICTLHECLGPI